MTDNKEPTRDQMKARREKAANISLDKLIKSEAAAAKEETTEFLRFALNSWSIQEKIKWLKTRGHEINITYK